MPFTMRGATDINHQRHPTPCLPRNINSWLILVTYETMLTMRAATNVTKYCAVTQNDSNAWSSSHMKRHLQCAEQHVSPSNLTKYCACQAKWLACLIVLTYEKSFTVTMSGATSVTPQPHQILRLPRKMTPMLGPRHIWNITYNARSNRCHPPTSPNIAPAAKNATAKFQRKFPKTGETSFTMRGRSENDPSMIRPWNRQSATRLATEITFRGHHEHLNSPTTFRTPAIIQNFTKCCPCHEKWHSNLTKYCACHNIFYYLPLLLLYDFYDLLIQLLHDSITWQFYCLTILLLDDSITWRFYYLTISNVLDDSITWRFLMYLTILLLDNSMTWRFYYVTILLLFFFSAMSFVYRKFLI